MNKILANNIFLVVIIAAVLFVVFVLALNWMFMPTLDRVEWAEESYVVAEGDSLWAIAGDYCPGNVDRWEWIHEVQALNDLPDSGVIHPGQVLTVLTPAA